MKREEIIQIGNKLINLLENNEKIEKIISPFYFEWNNGLCLTEDCEGIFCFDLTKEDCLALSKFFNELSCILLE